MTSPSSRSRALLALPVAAHLALLVAALPAEGQRDRGAPQSQAPLAVFTADHVVVMPVQLFRADSGSLVGAGAWPTFRKEVDDSIGLAIAERGIGKKWAYAADVLRMAKRNVPYASDPYSLGAQPLRGRPIKGDDPVPPLMVSNMRSLIALGDARFAMVPLEMAFVRDKEGQRLVVRLVIIDGRTGRFVWEGEAASDPAKAISPAVAGSLAQHVADLVASR